MARLISTSRTSDAPHDALDPSIEWSATLVQPTSTVEPDSRQPLIVRVEAPIVLDDEITIGVGSRRFPAAWLGEPGHQRTATLTLSPDVPAGRITIHVGAVVLAAGRLRRPRRR